MQTKQSKKRKSYAIKKSSITKVCSALIEMSQFSGQDSAHSATLNNICKQNNVPKLLQSMVQLGYVERLNFKSYKILFSREYVNEKLATKFYKHYNKINGKYYIPKNSLVKEVKPVVTDVCKLLPDFPTLQKKLLFAVIKEEYLVGALQFDSINDLVANPPKDMGKYVVVSIGRGFEVKPTVIMD